MSGVGTWRRVGLAAAAVTIAASSACGARWTDEQREAVVARAQGANSSGSGPVAAGSPAAGGGTATTSPGGSSGAAPASGGGVSGGGSPSAGGAAAQGPQGSSALPCSAPSDASGVTDTEITVGSISSVSGPVPGLGYSSESAARAYVAYRNATGGVCGRQIVLRTADDGADNGRHRAAMTQFATQVLGIVGGLGTGDGGSADVVTSENIPVVSLPTADVFEAAPTVFDTNPPFADLSAVIGKYRYLVEQGVRTGALVYTAVDQARSQIEVQRAQMEAAGIQIVLDYPAPLSTLSWDSAARAVANSGADYMFFLSHSSADAAMAQALVDANYELRFEEYLTAYGSNFIDLAGSAAEGTTSWIRTLPNEDGGTVPEQAAFLEWMAQTAPDAVADTFASDSWVGAKAFFDALEALPGPISRDGLLAQLRATGTYDAGGFLGAIQLGPKLHGGCFIAMIVEGGAWRRLTPATGFLC